MEGLKRRFDCTLDGGVPNEVEVVCVQILSFPKKTWFSPLRRQYQTGEINAIVIQVGHGTEEQYRRIGIARVPTALQGSDWEIQTITIVLRPENLLLAGACRAMQYCISDID